MARSVWPREQCNHACPRTPVWTPNCNQQHQREAVPCWSRRCSRCGPSQCHTTRCGTRSSRLASMKSFFKKKKSSKKRQLHPRTLREKEVTKTHIGNPSTTVEVLHVLVSRQSQRRENSAGRGRAALATSSSVSFFGFLEKF